MPKFWLAALSLVCILHCRAEASHSHKYKGANKGLKIAGDVGQVAIPAAAMAATLGLKDYKGALQFLEAGAATAVTVIALKYSIHSRRPSGKAKHSFPSGHTAAAFCGASYVQWRYGGLYSLPAYAGAVVVGYSRVQSKVHWVHDVVVGAAIGFIYSFVFTTPYHPKTRIHPAVTKDGVALHCSHSF
jgi:membrane-associated phospholipid phosphatase